MSRSIELSRGLRIEESAAIHPQSVSADRYAAHAPWFAYRLRLTRYSAMDYYFDHLKKTVASARRAEHFRPSGGTEFGEKAKACATQELVRELSYAKDIQDMLRIQMEFMRSQAKIQQIFARHHLLIRVE